ncbi:MAG: tRNA 2-selenouridine(34) synthase MnmH [Pseudomonadales bacterium]
MSSSQGSALDALLSPAVPKIDLRAPAEFALGTLPGAVNLPILTDQERHQIGKCYRQHGQPAAVKMGHRLVAGAIRETRIDGWQQFLADHPDAAVFCWRGGMRTEFARAWLADRDLTPPAITGGFKAARSRALAILANDSHRANWLMLGGRTGVGKTVVLNQLPNSIDLEGLACHRGSAFGGMERPQPTPVSFENQLAAIALAQTAVHETIVLEDESRTIGRLALPESWHARMQQAPLVLLEAPRSSRAAHIAAEYVTEPLALGVPPARLAHRYRSALQRIRKRLGGARTSTVIASLDQAFSNEVEHLQWITQLLEWYYDPMYDFQLKKKAHRVVFSGEAPAVLNWIQDARG